ncbi:MAG: hypothetical protein AseanaTS_08070 [Candidatus Pelagadaptatus aseana]|uniref:SHOCT domain-containing protein n=1 Tax=Candidatus Pelagadaptatus aseana TaxID=3120508 RepID=UPI0039B1FEF7
MKHIILAAIIAATPLLTACGGGDSNIQTHSNTQGQELMDLKTAYDSGILTEKEYEKAKKEILKR